MNPSIKELNDQNPLLLPVNLQKVIKIRYG